MSEFKVESFSNIRKVLSEIAYDNESGLNQNVLNMLEDKAKELYDYEFLTVVEEFFSTMSIEQIQEFIIEHSYSDSLASLEYEVSEISDAIYAEDFVTDMLNVYQE